MKLVILSCLIFVFVVACESNVPPDTSTLTLASTEQPLPTSTLEPLSDFSDASEDQCITALIYLLQDHEHPVVTSSGGPGSSGGFGDADKAVIGDEERVSEILTSYCDSFTDATLLAELKAWPRENLIQSGPRKGMRRE